MREIRIKLLLVTSILIASGIVMIYSSSAIYALDKFGDAAFFLKRHLVFILAGLVFFFGALAVDLKFLKRHAGTILYICIFLLVIVLIPKIGTSAGGARRWMRIGFFGFQPSEAAKLAIIVFTASYLSGRSAAERREITAFIRPSVLTALCIALILMQPDLGSSVLILAVVFAIFFVAGMGMRYILAGFLSTLPFIAALIFFSAYRLNRITAFINPWKDPRGTGFQMVQSFLALGRGGLFGVGLGQSKQKLFYLPASHTDFIFSIIGEELGLIGAGAVVVLFIFFIRYAAKIVLTCPDNFKRLMGFGLVTMIALEAIVNIAVTTGSMPTKGLPLPFISYGGSNLVLNMAAVAFILNISKNPGTTSDTMVLR